MSKEIETYISYKDIDSAIGQCEKEGQFFLSAILKILYNKHDIKKQNYTRVKLMASWCSCEQIRNIWNKMSKGNYTWNNIKLVLEQPIDYYVIINKPFTNEYYDPFKTIIFQMEPYMEKKNNIWGEWSNPVNFLKVYKHNEGEYNNNEWHLSLDWCNLQKDDIVKNKDYSKIISVIISGKYTDIGQIKRVDFVKFLEEKGIDIHIFGNNRFNYKNYKKPLPEYNKDEGLLPYKYTFNVENNQIPYYYTEKLIDGILSETLTFYHGCPNIRELIDPRAYVELELSNFEKDLELIKTAIKEDWHSQRLPFIRNEKKRILNELQFFPRLEKIIEKSKLKN